MSKSTASDMLADMKAISKDIKQETDKSSEMAAEIDALKEKYKNLENSLRQVTAILEMSRVKEQAVEQRCLQLCISLQEMAQARQDNENK